MDNTHTCITPAEEKTRTRAANGATRCGGKNDADALKNMNEVNKDDLFFGLHSAFGVSRSMSIMVTSPPGESKRTQLGRSSGAYIRVTLWGA